MVISLNKIAHLTAFCSGRYLTLSALPIVAVGEFCKQNRGVQHRSLQSGNLSDFLSNLNFVKGFNGHNYEKNTDSMFVADFAALRLWE